MIAMILRRVKNLRMEAHLDFCAITYSVFWHLMSSSIPNLSGDAGAIRNNIKNSLAHQNCAENSSASELNRH
ncbi:MAG: hypothetical protein NTX50_30755 [Candidatus Sumerlaeota bacterium]|nr:hypothetical protein [Candidatus Sumerlaeota bacterium]